MKTPRYIEMWRYVLTAICLASLIEAPAQSLLRLEQATDMALANNHQLLILRANEMIAQNSNNAANADFLPTVSANGGYGFTSTNTKQEFFNGDSRSANAAGSRSANASLTANWTVFDGFRREAVRQGLALDEQRASEQTRIEALQLLEEIHLSYYQLAQIQRQIQLTRHSINLNASILSLARQKQQIGVGSQAEVLQAQGQLNADSVLLISQEGNLRRGKISFNQLINQAVDQDFVVDTAVSMQGLPAKEALLSEASQRNPNLLLAQLNQLATAWQIKEVKSVLFPKLDLTAAYNYNFSRADVGFLLSNRTFGPTARASVTYDLFSGRNIKKELANIKLIRENLKTDEDRLRWEIESAISDLYANYANLADLQQAEQKNIVVAEQNTTLANELYLQGRNTNFEVREAVLREIQAKDRLIQTTYNMKYVEIQLQALAGALLPP